VRSASRSSAAITCNHSVAYMTTFDRIANKTQQKNGEAVREQGRRRWERGVEWQVESREMMGGAQ
jgi:hypothetical protein